jgi:hypothetical protein
MPTNFHDFIAGTAALMLLAAIIGLACIGRSVPPELSGVAGIAGGWVFRGASNGYLNGRNKPT